MFSGGFYCSFIWETRKNICANLSWCRNFPDTKLSWPQSFLVLICLQSNRAGAKSFWCHIFLMPNCSGAILSGSKLSGCQIVLVPNCSGAKLSWCQIIWGQNVMVPNCLVTNCPGAKLSWCQIVRCQIVRCQIVLPPFHQLILPIFPSSQDISLSSPCSVLFLQVQRENCSVDHRTRIIPVCGKVLGHTLASFQ